MKYILIFFQVVAQVDETDLRRVEQTLAQEEARSFFNLNPKS